MRVDPDDPEPVDSLRDASHTSDVCAAAAAEDDRSRGERVGNRGGLLVERVALDDRDLRIRQRDARSLGHGLAAGTPRSRHPHEAGRERAPAAVALVAVTDRDRRERPAARAARAQRAHAASFS